MKDTEKWVKKVPEGSMKLQVQTVTLVPSTMRMSQPISPASFKRRIRETKMMMSALFGGYTMLRGEGGYTSGSRLITERVAEVVTFAEIRAFHANKDRWLKWVHKKGKEWGQESMGVIIENDLMYLNMR